MSDPVVRGIVIPDMHVPLHDLPAFRCVLKAIEIVKPTRFINLGDVGEFAGVSHWQWRKKRRPPLEYQIPFITEDNMAVNKVLDQIDEKLDKVKCKERYYTQGNHCRWNDHFVEENPYLDNFGFVKAMRIKERGYIYKEAGDMLKLGKINFYHGHLYGGLHHARNHLIQYGANIMFGHHHDVQQASLTHLDGTKQAWSIGCLKDMSRSSNEWLGGRPTRWGHAMAIVDWWDGGHFTVNVVNIIGGRCSLWGHVINGNK
jgi:hypothetical protein